MPSGATGVNTTSVIAAPGWLFSLTTLNQHIYHWGSDSHSYQTHICYPVAADCIAFILHVLIQYEHMGQKEVV